MEPKQTPRVLIVYFSRSGHTESVARALARASGADLADAVATAVTNKRAGGMGLISGRKAFQRAFAEGVQLLNGIQDVYLCKEITIA